MKVFFHNFDPRSNSGPNKFTRSLFNQLINEEKVKISNLQTEADLEFCLIQQSVHKKKPMMLRLDGIYFNSDQNFKEQNKPIRFAYENAEAVVFQSNFNKKLTEAWFGPHKNSAVIRNGSDFDLIKSVKNSVLDHVVKKSADVWSCASSWRPHKRLEENLRYFERFSSKNAVMIVAGKDADTSIIKKYNSSTNGRIYYVGELTYVELLSLYKRSSTFVHLAYLDHCPNVVVDARASGCKIVCASSGGTKEIAGTGAKIIQEEEWNFDPIRLYSPPRLELENQKDNDLESNIDIKNVANQYYQEMLKIY